MRTIAVAIVLSCVVTTARAELRPKSRNTLLFVEKKTGEEWDQYRVVEDRRPVVFQVDGPGRVLLSLRTYAKKSAPPAVSVVLLDDKIVMTGRVAAKEDDEARFVDVAGHLPSKVRFYLVRVPPGVHRVVVRYSGGGATLVSARYSEEREAWDGGEGGDLPLVMPRVERPAPPPEPAAKPAEEELPEGDPDWALPKPEARDLLEPHTGPQPREEPSNPGSATRSQKVQQRVKRPPLTVPAPWFLYELRAGVQFNRLGVAVAPSLGMDARIAVPGLDARAFNVGLSAEVTHTQGESEVHAAGQDAAVIGVAKVRHTAFTAGLDVRWSFLGGETIDPYIGLGAGALFGSMSTSVADQQRDAGTKGLFGVGVLGAAFGGMGHRPYFELRVQAGLLSSALTRAGRADAGGATSHVATNLMVGYRFELMTEVAAR